MYIFLVFVFFFDHFYSFGIQFYAAEIDILQLILK